MRVINYRGVNVQVTVDEPLFFLALFERDDCHAPMAVCRQSLSECQRWIRECHESYGVGTAHVVDIMMQEPPYYSALPVPISRYWRPSNAS